MKITNIKIEEIKPYEYNAKTHPEEQIKKIANSIKEFGFNVPILINKDKEIIAGHGRLLAAIQLGLKEIPSIMIEHLNEQQIKAYRIADNKTAESEWEYDFLKNEIINLQENGFDVELTGFTQEEIDQLLGNRELSQEEIENIYTQKIIAPTYTPSEKKPNEKELYDTTKTEELIKKIREANITEEQKEFLEKTAQRFIIFHYDKIADYYAHSEKETQTLMEQLALVIIDFNKAIENGFIKLTKEIADQYLEEEEDG